MDSRLLRTLSVSYSDLLRPGPANTRVAVFLYLVVGVVLSLWLYVLCVTSCPREVQREVSLPSGPPISILYIDDDIRHPWIEYVTNTNGEPAAVRNEARKLLEALQADSLVSAEWETLDFEAWHIQIGIRTWYGPLPDVRCCMRTMVRLDRATGEETIVQHYAYRSNTRANPLLFRGHITLNSSGRHRDFRERCLR